MLSHSQCSGDRRATGTLNRTHLKQLWLLQFETAIFESIELLKQLEEFPMSDHHFHLLFGSPISMANDANHTPQLLPANTCWVDGVSVGMYLDQTHACTRQHILGPDMCLDQICIWTTNILGPDMYLDQTCTWTRHVPGPDMYLDQTCTWTRHVPGPDMYLDQTRI